MGGVLLFFGAYLFQLLVRELVVLLRVEGEVGVVELGEPLKEGEHRVMYEGHAGFGRPTPRPLETFGDWEPTQNPPGPVGFPEM